MDGVIKVENGMNFLLENRKKNITMVEGDEEHYRNDNACRFCENSTTCNKVRDQCHLPSKNGGPAHSI